MYGMTADQEDAYHLLKLAESGRPEEQMAQFVASMISCGGMQSAEVTKFFARVMGRVTDLLDGEDMIWDHLMPGGNQTLFGPEEMLWQIVDDIKNDEIPEMYFLRKKVVEFGLIDDFESQDAKVYVLGEHVCDGPSHTCWMVLSIDSGAFGYWRGSTYKPLWTTDDSINPNDLMLVNDDDVDWIDTQLTIQEARKRLQQES